MMKLPASLIAAVLLAIAAPAAALTSTGLVPVDELLEPVTSPDPVTQEARRAGTIQPAAASEALRGTFGIEGGSCAQGGVSTGSYFRMITPGGQVGQGPYVNNSSSPCGDNTWTPVLPGTDRGLSTEDYQPHPDPDFDGRGNALAERIIKPQGFNGARFSVATSPVDPQTRTEVPVPRISHDGGQLSGNLSAWAAAWNGQHFNQGAPKPDGSKPGNTTEPTGTYNPATGGYVLEWASQIVGGPFNNFTGFWHLEGTFVSAGGAQPSPTTAAGKPGDAPPTTGAPSATVAGTTQSAAAAGRAGTGRLPQTGGAGSAAGAVLALSGLAGLRMARKRA